MKKVALVVAVGLVGLAVFLVNPRFFEGVLFVDDDAEGDAAMAEEMRAAIEGEWLLSLPEHADGGARQIRFEVRQAGPERRSTAPAGIVQEATACAHRTLVRSAAACLDSWGMPLEIELIAGLAPGAKLEGSYTRYGGTSWTHFVATLDGEEMFEAELARSGEVQRVETRWSSGANLSRIAAP